MYEDFFKLATLPFENTPDPRFFFASEQHREALAAIEYTIRMRKGIVLITGAIGSGKTTVGHTMWQRCGSQTTIVEIGHGHEDRHALLRQVLRQLELPHSASEDHAVLVERLRTHLLEQVRRDQPVVLFVDEAQTLSDDALEELRLLSNLGTATDKAIQIVLIGQPKLRQRIRSQRHDALRQRIVMSKQLLPLNRTETLQYVTHRLRAASSDPDEPAVCFSDAAVDAIFTYTWGVPRLINVACDNCLLLGFVRGSRQITPAIVERVVQDMVPSFSGSTVQDEPSQSLVGSA